MMSMYSLEIPILVRKNTNVNNLRNLGVEYLL